MAQPGVRRNIESGLWSCEHAFGQSFSHQIFEEKFLGSSSNLEIFRESRGKLQNPMVQEGRTHFNGMRHAHTIDFGKEIVGQIVVLIELQVPIQADAILVWTKL